MRCIVHFVAYLIHCIDLRLFYVLNNAALNLTKVLLLYIYSRTGMNRSSVEQNYLLTEDCHLFITLLLSLLSDYVIS